jgi:hypothetical protein
MGSIYRLEVAVIVVPDDKIDRARNIVEQLKAHVSRIDEVSDVLFRVVVVDRESRASALDYLSINLDRIDDDWQDFLRVG